MTTQFGNGSLKVGFKEWRPFTMYSMVNGERVMTGFMIDLLQEIGRNLNLRFDYIDLNDVSWGNLGNGTWTGLLGKLYTKEVDFIAPLYGTERDRNEHFDSTYPVLFHFPTIGVYRKEPNEEASFGAHMIGWEILLLIILSLFISTFILTLTSVLWESNVTGQSYLHVLSIKLPTELWYRWRNLVNQGNVDVQTKVNRFVLASWWLFCVIMSSIISATLVASFSTTNPKMPFTSLELLTKQNVFKWGMDEDSSLYLYAQQTRHYSPWGMLLKGMEQFSETDHNVLSTSAKVQIAKVKAGRYVYIVYEPVVSRAIANDCNLTFFKIQFRNTVTSIMFWKGSPYRDIFSNEIVRLHETGIIEYLLNKWVIGKRVCPVTRTLGKKLNLDMVYAIFWALLLGICLASVTFFLEILWSCSKKRCIR